MAPTSIEPRYWFDFIKTRGDPEGQKAFTFNNTVMAHCNGDTQELVKMIDANWYRIATKGSELPANAHPDQKSLVREVAGEYNALKEDIDSDGTFMTEVVNASTDADGVLQLFQIWESIGALWTQKGNTIALDKNVWSFVYFTVLEAVDTYVNPDQWEEV